MNNLFHSVNTPPVLFDALVCKFSFVRYFLSFLANGVDVKQFSFMLPSVMEILL